MNQPDQHAEPTASPADTRHDGMARWWFRLAVAVSVSPILIAAVRNGLGGWFPAWRSGYVAVMTNDVFTSHIPLVGPYAATSYTAAEPYNFPGAIQMYLLAVPVKLLGPSWGILSGMAAINTAAFVTAMWLVRRRVGYRLGLLGCVFGASLIYSLGSQVVVDATPLVMGYLPFVVVLVAAWSVADGDARGLLPLAVAANFLLLGHLKFTVTVPMIGLVALVLWGAHLHRARRHDPAGWPAERRRQLRWFAASAAVGLVMWLPALAQQIFSRQGNLALLVGSTGGSDGADRGLLDVLGVVFAPLISWPLWFRQRVGAVDLTDSTAVPSLLVGSAGAALVIVVSVVVLVAARRRADTQLIRGLAIAVTAFGGWAVSAMANPSIIPFAPDYFNELRPLAMFTWFVLAVGILRMLGSHLGRWPTAERTRIAAVVLVAVFAIASIPVYHDGQLMDDDGIELSRGVYEATKASVPAGGPVLVEDEGPNASRFVPAVLLGLQARGIGFRVTAVKDIAMYGPKREFHDDPPNATRRIQVRATPDPAMADDLLASIRVEPPPILRDVGLRDDIRDWSRATTRVEVPSSSDMEPESARNRSVHIEHRLGELRREGATPARQRQLAEALARLDRTQLAAVVDIPAQDPADVYEWIQEEATFIPGLWLYLSDL